MPTINLPLSIDTISNQAGGLINQLQMNMYPVVTSDGQESKNSLRQRFLFEEIYDAGEEVRGIKALNNYLYVVGLTKFERVDYSGTVANTYTMTAGGSGERFILLDNYAGQIGMLSQTGTYRVFDRTTSTISAPSFPSGSTGVFMVDMNSYWLFVDAGFGREQQLFWCALGDGTTFDSLNFTTAYEKSDRIQELVALNNILYVFGRSSIEFFTTPASGSPAFEKIPGASITNIGGTASVAIQNRVYFTGTDGIVYRMEGFNPVKISNEYIEEFLSRISGVVPPVRGRTYFERGQYFYEITRTQSLDDFTLVYNITTGKWHKRQSFGQKWWRHILNTNEGNQQFFAYGNKIYKLVPRTNSMGDVTSSGNMRREFTTYYVNNDDKNVIHFSLTLEAYLNKGSSFTPMTIEMTYSDNGGKDFSSPRTLVISNYDGNYNDNDNLKRIEFRGLGVSRERYYKFVVTGQGEFSVHKCTLGVEIESNA